MRVASPTDAVGYYTFNQTCTTALKLGDRPWGNIVTFPYQYARSNKSVLVKGQPPLATSYFRKVGRLTSVHDVGLYSKSTNRSVRGDSSLPWFTLASAPYGSNYSAGPVAIPSWMTDKVIQDAIVECREVSANILEDLGQAKSTLQLAVSVVNLVADLWLAFFRGQWGRLAKLARKNGLPETIASSWLAFYYGIKPLVGTLDAILNTGPRPISRVVRKRITVKCSAHPFLGNTLGTYAFLYEDASQGAECSLRVTYTASDTMRYWQSLGLTSNLWNDALVTAWALIPFSFVFDWFIPVERFLRTRVWDSSLTLKAGHVGRKLSCRALAQVNNKGVANAAPDAVGQWPLALVECLQYNRTAYNDFPPPSGLSFSVGLNPTRLINAAALLTLLTSKR